MKIHLQVAVCENGVTTRHVFKLAEGPQEDLDMNKYRDLHLMWDGDEDNLVWIWVTASLSDDELRLNYEKLHG